MSPASDPPARQGPPIALPARRARTALPSVRAALPAAGSAQGDAPAGPDAAATGDGYTYGPGTVPWQPQDTRSAGPGGSGGGAYQGPTGGYTGQPPVNGGQRGRRSGL